MLILDELDYVPFSKTGAELLFDVVSRAAAASTSPSTGSQRTSVWSGVSLMTTKSSVCGVPRLQIRRPLLRPTCAFGGASFLLINAQGFARLAPIPVKGAMETKALRLSNLWLIGRKPRFMVVAVDLPGGETLNCSVYSLAGLAGEKGFWDPDPYQPSI